MAINCLSCEILASKRTSPGGTVYEDEHWHVNSVLAPVYWQGFLIIKLKRHCEHLAELTPEESASLGPVIQLTCQALTNVLDPAKVYICSFGDGVKHIHFWALPRPQSMRPGMRTVFRYLNVRAGLTRLGFKRWVYSDEEVAALVSQLREEVAWLTSDHGQKAETWDAITELGNGSRTMSNRDDTQISDNALDI